MFALRETVQHRLVSVKRVRRCLYLNGHTDSTNRQTKRQHGTHVLRVSVPLLSSSLRTHKRIHTLITSHALQHKRRKQPSRASSSSSTQEYRNREISHPRYLVPSLFFTLYACAHATRSNPFSFQASFAHSHKTHVQKHPRLPYPYILTL